MTREAFRAWAAAQTERWEWIDGYAFPLPLGFAGGTWQHAEVASRLMALLAASLQPPCRAIIGDMMRVATPTSERYGDILIVCRRPNDRTVDVINDVTAIVEIVSQNSGERDLLDKRREYVAMPNLEAYVAIFENEPKALVYRPNESDVAVSYDAIDIHGVTIALPQLYV